MRKVFDPRLKRETFFFAVGGLSNTLVYIAAFFLLLNFMKTSLLLSTAIAYLFAAVFGFVFNAVITFDSGNVKSKSQMVKYALLYTFGLIYNSIIVVSLSNSFKFTPGQSFLIVAITWPILSFGLSRLLVFR